MDYAKGERLRCASDIKPSSIQFVLAPSTVISAGSAAEATYCRRVPVVIKKGADSTGGESSRWLSVWKRAGVSTFSPICPLHREKRRISPRWLFAGGIGDAVREIWREMNWWWIPLSLSLLWAVFFLFFEALGGVFIVFSCGGSGMSLGINCCDFWGIYIRGYGDLKMC